MQEPATHGSERHDPGSAAFVVDLDGFEGPLDLLLDLARAQKVDLARISILALVEQYLAYLEEARAQQLTLAAEYLVMAAWLCFLKSQLLLPKEERQDEDVEGLAEALAARLRKLDAIRRAVVWLEEQPQLGSARLVRGSPEEPPVRHDDHWRADLAGLLESYARIMGRRRQQSIRLVPRKAMSVEAALDRLSRLLAGRDWQELSSFLPPGLDDAFLDRSAMAASLVASLELTKRGTIDLEQAQPFGPIRIRRR
jgi:segregation and condensation protein A